MEKPRLALIDELEEIKGNKRFLLEKFGFKSITQAKKSFGESADECYQFMFSDYNKKVRQQNISTRIKYNKALKKWMKEEVTRKSAEQARVMIAKEKKRQQKKVVIKAKYLLHINYEVQYKRWQTEGVERVAVLSNPYPLTAVLGPFHDAINTIPDKIKEFNNDEYSKIIRVVSYNVEYMKEMPKAVPKVKQMMTRGFILRNDWLHYAQSISENAYVQTDNKCVYYQLEKFLSDPPTGRPTKFIGSKRLSEEALFEFFKPLCEGKYEIQMGVSTEMIGHLCKFIKRNMYAYDEDSKCFHSITTNDSKNYCPIVFYKLHGHFYLVDDPKAIRSVAESNKDTAKKIISSIADEKLPKEEFGVFHLDEFPLDNIHELTSGVYILQQSSLNKDVIQYVCKYSAVPRTKNNENSIVQIKVSNGEKKPVFVACDTNYGKNIDYEQLMHVATTNGLKYTNEGIGTVIHKILEAKSKDIRKYLKDDEKEALIESFGHQCAECKLPTEQLAIDHIKPLGAGGSNDLSNLQPLCKDCHKKKTIQENEEGVYRVKDESESFFNDIVHRNIINTSHYKSYQFVEKVSENFMETPEYKIDMRKCRRNIVLNFSYEWPVYSVMDTPRRFSGEIQCGMYYVVCDNTFPFRGCGWYYEPLVKYGLSNGLIQLSNIGLEFIPSKKLPSSHFRKHVNTLLDGFSCEPTLQKLCVNAFIGLMGRTKQTASYSKFTLCPNEASSWWGDKLEDHNVFIRNHPLENGQVLYEGVFSQEVMQEGTRYPMYAMILQMEAIELHKLETIIIESGGVVLDRNTDAIRYTAEKECDIDQYFWDEVKQVAKYQTESPTPLNFEHLANMNRQHVLDYFDFDIDWQIKNDYEGTAEETAYEIVRAGVSCNLDGQPGTGKTYLGNKVIEELKKQGKRYMAFSPTNKGARLIGGQTIHSLFYKYQTNKGVFKSLLKNLDYIFIDEVSMMCERFFQLFVMAKRLFPSLKFIIIGDFAQLPPVKDTWSGDYKNSAAMFSLCDGFRIQLTKCRRSDSEVFDLYGQVDELDIGQFQQTEKTYLNLAYTHRTRIRVNRECMERYLKEFGGKRVSLPADKSNPKTQHVELVKGMPVIAHKTEKKLNILNSEKFTVKVIGKETITMTDDDRDIEIKISEFHKYFYLGFCITIHASQGETFKTKYSVYDWKTGCFCVKAKYVAISRATCIEHIQIVA